MVKHTTLFRQSHKLSPNIVRLLISNHLLGIHIPNFLPATPCENLARKIDSIAQYGKHQYSPKIGALGQSLHAACKQEQALLEYFNSASIWEAELQFMANSAGLRNPVKAIEEAVCSAWPHGMQREVVEGRTLFAGAARSFQPGASAPAHVDGFEVWLSRHDIHVPLPLHSQLAASVYLSSSSTGGELELWNWVPTQQQLIDYGTGCPLEVRRNDLYDPDVTVRPQSGDLIIYNARNIHAMRVTGPGLRAAVSLFLGARTESESLTFWS